MAEGCKVLASDHKTYEKCFCSEICCTCFYTGIGTCFSFKTTFHTLNPLPLPHWKANNCFIFRAIRNIRDFFLFICDSHLSSHLNNKWWYKKSVLQSDLRRADVRESFGLNKLLLSLSPLSSWIVVKLVNIVLKLHFHDNMPDTGVNCSKKYANLSLISTGLSGFEIVREGLFAFSCPSC